MNCLPDIWEEILKTNNHYFDLVNGTLTKYEGILESELFFFPEYTEHGVNHYRNLLHFAERFVNTSSYDSNDDKKGLGYKSLTALVLSCLLHDLGMHITYDGFICLLSNPNYQNTHSYDKNHGDYYGMNIYKMQKDGVININNKFLEKA